MDLSDLGLELRPRGRPAKEFKAEVERELTPGDLELLALKGEGELPFVKKLNARHHRVAQLTAQGLSFGEVAAHTGYNVQTIKLLMADATFKELVLFYQKDIQREYVELHQRLAGLSADAADELSRRLEETPEEFKIPQLMEVVKMGADRTGHGVQSTQQVNVNVGVADRLKEARLRAERAAGITKEPPIIDVTPERDDAA